MISLSIEVSFKAQRKKPQNRRIRDQFTSAAPLTPHHNFDFSKYNCFVEKLATTQHFFSKDFDNADGLQIICTASVAAHFICHPPTCSDHGNGFIDGDCSGYDNDDDGDAIMPINDTICGFCS